METTFFSGEVGFHRLSESFGWPKSPLIRRVRKWDRDLDVTFIFGARSWVDASCGRRTKELRPESYIDVQVSTYEYQR